MKRKNSKKRLIERLVSGEKRAPSRLKKIAEYRHARKFRLVKNIIIEEKSKLLEQPKSEVLFELTKREKQLLGEI